MRMSRTNTVFDTRITPVKRGITRNVPRPVSSLSTSCLNCSLGISRARCDLVAPDSRDKSVRGHGIGGAVKMVTHHNAQVGHNYPQDAAGPENTKTLLRHGTRLLVGKVFEAVRRIDARNRRIRKGNPLANIGESRMLIGTATAGVLRESNATMRQELCRSILRIVS